MFTLQTFELKVRHYKCNYPTDGQITDIFKLEDKLAVVDEPMSDHGNSW